MKPGKVITILGPRRIGKTFILEELIKKFEESFLLLNGEDFATHALLERRSIANYKKFIGTTKILIIDEAQKIPDIGNKLKLMIDELKDLIIIITGSSALDLTDKTGEPLTGRKISYLLPGVSEVEYSKFEKIVEKEENLRSRLIYGNYPELINLPTDIEKSEYLQDVVSSYLLKDLLTFDGVKNSNKLMDLLKLIAFQIGGLVSIQEIGTQLSLSKNTVEKYLDLLTKIFVLKNVRGYSRNLRKEIVKTSKWYFLDNGIRNAIIANFNPLELRNDVGQLWENYIISERLKFQNYSRMAVNNYFWRTYDRQEIDWIEEREGGLFGYELKWKEDKVKIPTAFTKAYPDAIFKVVTSENYFEWINYEGEVKSE